MIAGDTATPSREIPEPCGPRARRAKRRQASAVGASGAATTSASTSTAFRPAAARARRTARAGTIGSASSALIEPAGAAVAAASAASTGTVTPAGTTVRRSLPGPRSGRSALSELQLGAQHPGLLLQFVGRADEDVLADRVRVSHAQDALP